MKIYELLSDKSKWTKGAYARDVNGVKVTDLSKEAVSWCLDGAIEKCYSTYYKKLRIRNMLSRKIGCTLTFNDTHSYEDVIELVKELDI